MTSSITTTTQLEALPDGSVMRGKDDTLIERGTTPVASSPCTWIDGSWFLLPETIDLYAPLTVLHVPGQAVDCDHAALAHDLAKTTVLGLASAEEVVRAATTLATPAPTVKPGREEVAEVVGEHQWAGTVGRSHDDPGGIRWSCTCGHESSIDGMSGHSSWLAAHATHAADAVLAILPGKTEAQVRAEAWDLGVEAAVEAIFGPVGQPRRGVPRITWRTPDNPFRADEEAGK